ncbi:capsule biosynthesis protein [Inquilinus sp. Marseille-Q2685]|uniref:capsule biosynthesis protein n=1 Tax=Inquilinus sp. Marseille-Q2685 TaxID=2866581 RepID=UPI001CE421E8|nr:capsular biosynthesis protein [Inquilinus sp. Marseille-Q2685]
MNGRPQRPFAAAARLAGALAPPRPVPPQPASPQPAAARAIPAPSGTGRQRVVLVLQGAATPFQRRLAAALEAEGARIVKINICGGDVVFWRRPAIAFRGRFEDWRGFVADILDRERVTDLVLFGDCRPHHRVAVDLARRRGLRLHLFEEGYLRPGWVTCEAWGVNGHSDLPRSPAAFLALARGVEPPPPPAPVPSYFLHRAVWDVLWTAGLVALMPAFPHYRHHALDHPLVEYAGWVGRFLRAPWARRRARRVMQGLAGQAGRYYLHPLQLDTDFQIRTHSPFRDTVEAAEEVIASFARSADPGTRLVVKLHPLDFRPVAKQRRIEALAARHGVAGRVDFIDGGDLQQLVDGAIGVVVVNSTVGLFALERGRPLQTLGTAVFDLPGLSFQGGLDRFWAEGQPPRPDLLEAFRRVVVARTQIRGSFFSLQGIDLAVDGARRRILDGEVRPLREAAAWAQAGE